MQTGRLARFVWVIAGSFAVAVGAIGIVVPGLPTTVFFILAAWCFSRGSPRLEQWVLDLPRIGPLVRDHRAGLGMPRRAKLIAVAMIAGFVVVSAVTIDATLVRSLVLLTGGAGMTYVWYRVPTREHVLGSNG